MMNVVLRLALVVVLLAVGFGIGWVVFEKPFTGTTANEVELALLRHIGNPDDASWAECQEAQYPSNSWGCQTPIKSARLEDQLETQHRWTVTFSDGQFRFEDHGECDTSIGGCER